MIIGTVMAWTAIALTKSHKIVELAHSNKFTNVPL